VLIGLSFAIQQGEHTAILGPNGAGKTSLIRMLTLDDRPRPSDNGTPALRLFGREHWDIGELAHAVGCRHR
jgi:iron complex transport system ATP-binding protein